MSPPSFTLCDQTASYNNFVRTAFKLALDKTNVQFFYNHSPFNSKIPVTNSVRNDVAYGAFGTRTTLFSEFSTVGLCVTSLCEAGVKWKVL